MRVKAGVTAWKDRPDTPGITVQLRARLHRRVIGMCRRATHPEAGAGQWDAWGSIPPWAWVQLRHMREASRSDHSPMQVNAQADARVGSARSRLQACLRIDRTPEISTGHLQQRVCYPTSPNLAEGLTVRLGWQATRSPQPTNGAPPADAGADAGELQVGRLGDQAMNSPRQRARHVRAFCWKYCCLAQIR